MSPSPTAREFDDGLLDFICAIVEPGQVIETLTSKRPNRIIAIDHVGILVETQRSDERGAGPQLVPAWMVIVAWEHLRLRHVLSQNELLNELNVKRSAFVCALLRLFPGVVVQSTRPTVLELVEK